MQTKRSQIVIIFLSILLISSIFLLKSCVRMPERGDTVVTSTAVIADMLRGITGELVSVSHLIGPGVDPHTYIPSRQDIDTITKARLVIYNGLHLEGALYNVLRNNEEQNPYYALSDTLPSDELFYVGETEADPHLWMDVKLWTKAVEPMLHILTDYYQEHADQFRENAISLRTDLAELHEWTMKQINTVPLDKRVLITSHDAFNYFGRAYQFEVFGIQGISTVTEASLSEINSLVDLLVERDIKAIFIETSVSPKNIRALVEGSRAVGHKVNIGGALFSDSLGEENTKEATYKGMIEYNTTTIVNGLGYGTTEQ